MRASYWVGSALLLAVGYSSLANADVFDMQYIYDFRDTSALADQALAQVQVREGYFSNPLNNFNNLNGAAAASSLTALRAPALPNSAASNSSSVLYNQGISNINVLP